MCADAGQEVGLALRVRPDAGRCERVARERQCLLVAQAMVAVVEQRRFAAAEQVGRAVGDGPLPRGPAVLELGVHLPHRLAVGLADGVADVREQAMEPARVLRFRRGPGVAGGQACGGELMDQRVQLHARAVLAHQRLVGERAQHGERGAGDRAGRVRREAAAKDGQAREHVALDRRQQPPRLVEDRLDARVPLRTRGIVAAQERRALLQLRGDRRTGQHAGPRCGELEREREAFDLAADVDDRGGLGRGRQRRLDATGRLREQAHRVERLEVIGVLRLGARQPVDAQQVLRCNAEPHARRHDDPQAGAGAEHALEHGPGGGHVLEVVEHQQHPAGAQERDHLRLLVGAALQVDADRARDPGADLVRAGDVLERDEHGAVGKPVGKLRERALREAGLADAARTDEVEQPAGVLRQQLGDALQLDRAADEVAVGRRGRRRLGGRGGRAGRAERIVQRDEFRAGREAKVGREAADECLIGLPRAGALPGAGEARHVRAQRGLVERVRCEQLRRERDALRGVDVGGETGQRRAAPRDQQPVALEAEPALPRVVPRVVESREQFARAQCERVGRAPGRERRLELGDVGRGDDAHGAAVHVDAAAPRHRLQAEQRLAQVRVRELVGLLGPEHRGQLRPAHPRALQREQHQQLAAPLERQHERSPVDRGLRCAEQLQANRHVRPRDRELARMRLSAGARKTGQRRGAGAVRV